MLSSKFKAILKTYGIDINVGKTIEVERGEFVIRVTFAEIIHAHNIAVEEGWCN
ncbi:hypothetical protein ACFO6R_06515 [Eubacterium multiforme]|uniref:Uncharacterized protein n=1 Tax=Eubacterium multiforme TaxID=83339 RepID=A0ABT9USF4_9FIRM|nr:hypothetical protein [Eubacterium multiforme]MDQ0149247.1 hypothetical protein [Eubacterium multiforme]